MKLKEKIRRGASAGVVAGVLSVAMLAGQAAPANAVLPLIPVAAGAVGATSVGAAVSGWAIAGYAALTAGTLWASMAIQENASIWMDDARKLLDPAKTPVEDEVHSNPPHTAGAQASDGFFIWASDEVDLLSGTDLWWDERQVSGAPEKSNRVNFTFRYSGNGSGGTAMRFTWVAEVQCQRFADKSVYNEVSYFKASGIMQGGSDEFFRQYKADLGCRDSLTAEPVAAKIRSGTTFERHDPAKFNLQPGDAYYAYHYGPKREYYSKAPGFGYADPGYRVTVECVNKAGVKSTLSLDSGYDPDGKVGVPSCKAAGLGEAASSLTIDYIDGTRTIGPAFKTIPQADTLLECDPAFGNVCKLEIYIDGIPCVVGTVQCAGWVSQHQADPARVKCYYGSREVSISNCGILEGSYVYGGSPHTKNNTDGDPNTWDDPRKVPGWSPKTGPGGEPSTDPDTDGTTQPNPNDPANQPSPSPSPSTGTEPGTEPGTGGSTTTFPQTGTNPSTTTGTDGQNCLATGWSWNPVSWVMVPVQCALQWAFVPPKTRIDAAVDTLLPKMQARGIEPFVVPVMTAFSSLGGAGCSGPAFDLSSIGLNQTYYFFSACDAPMSHIATGVNSFFALSIVVQGGMSCIRGVASAFGFNWGLGKGDDS